MKKRAALILVIALLGGLWPVSQTQASHADAFTFFIPWEADRLAEFFRLENQFVGIPGQAIVVDSVEYTIGISVLRDGSLIYYDHWEDELEENILFPVQPSTEVWGDGDPANGAPPGDPADILSAGEVIILNNIAPVPRNQANFFFDGGDKLVSVGGAIAVTMSAWPQPNGRILFADSWELLAVGNWGDLYVSPIGEDVDRPNAVQGGAPGTAPGFGFTVTMLVVQAADDDTTVEIDLDGDGNVDRTVQLNEGEQYNSLVDRPPNGLGLPVSAGARVQSTDPEKRVQTLLFTKDPLTSYQARGFTLIPDDFWSDDYLAPRSSDGDFWLYNPDPTTDLVVQVETAAGPQPNITIPPMTAARYPALPDPVLGTSSGVHLTSTDGRPFYGVAALDESDFQDWGYALVPTEFASTQALIGWAPGNNNTPPNGDQSRVYVTALSDTTVIVDLGADGTPDGSVAVSPLAEADIAGFDDLTGAFLYTENQVPFLAVWGQDQGAAPALPSIDVGNNIVPLRSLSIQKAYTQLDEGFTCGIDAPPSRVRFSVYVYNDSRNPVSNVVVTDQLSANMTYVPGSTTVNGSPIVDNNGRFPLEDGYSVGDVPGLGSVFIQFDVDLKATGEYVNQARVSPGGGLAVVELTLPFRPAEYQITKTLVEPPSGTADPGQLITFDVTVRNTGEATIVVLPLRDEFDLNYLTAPSANPPFDAQTAGSVDWNNVAPAGGLLPGEEVTVTLNFNVVNPLPANALETVNVILAAGVEVGEEGLRQAIVCDEAAVTFAVPTPTPTPTRPPRDDDDDDEEPTPTPRPPAPPATVPPAPAAPPPTPAVRLLPETGVGYANDQAPMWPLALLPGLGLVLGWVVYRRRRGK